MNGIMDEAKRKIKAEAERTAAGDQSLAAGAGWSTLHAAGAAGQAVAAPVSKAAQVAESMVYAMPMGQLIGDTLKKGIQSGVSALGDLPVPGTGSTVAHLLTDDPATADRVTSWLNALNLFPAAAVGTRGVGRIAGAAEEAGQAVQGIKGAATEAMSRGGVGPNPSVKGAGKPKVLSPEEERIQKELEEDRKREQENELMSDYLPIGEHGGIYKDKNGVLYDVQKDDVTNTYWVYKHLGGGKYEQVGGRPRPPIKPGWNWGTPGGMSGVEAAKELKKIRGLQEHSIENLLGDPNVSKERKGELIYDHVINGNLPEDPLEWGKFMGYDEDVDQHIGENLVYKLSKMDDNELPMYLGLDPKADAYIAKRMSGQ
jgi:hypothetical protein